MGREGAVLMLYTPWHIKIATGHPPSAAQYTHYNCISQAWAGRQLHLYTQ